MESRPIEQKLRGVAGSGKTTILAKRAVNASLKTRSRVLVLTYNITLKNYIHDKISEVKEDFGWDRFYIVHYHLFFKMEANNHNLVVKDWRRDPSDVDFFLTVEQETFRYDVVLIDEIHDYESQWIRLIKRYFLSPGGELVVCGDEKQNVYGRILGEDKRPNTTIPGRWNELNASHRASAKIVKLALAYQAYFFNDKYEMDTFESGDQADLLEDAQCIEYHDLVFGVSTGEIFDVIHRTVMRLGIHPNDVTVLSSKITVLRELDYAFRMKTREKTSTTFESKEDFERLQLDENKLSDLRRNRKFSFWAKRGTMKFATIHSFKGWETNTLFLIIEDGVPNEDTNDEYVSKETDDELVYTAITRCKQNLIVISKGSQKYRLFFQEYVLVRG